MTFAKGVTSAYAPLGGVAIRERYARTFDTMSLPGGHTYSGHPLAMSAGLGAIRAYRDEEIFARANVLEGWLRTRLDRLRERHEVIGDVRGAGAFFALDFVSDRTTREPLVAWQGAGMGVMTTLYKSLRDRGVYAFGRYNIVCIAPPLVATEAELDEAFEALDGAIGDLEGART